MAEEAEVIPHGAFRKDMEALASIIQRVRQNFPKMNTAQQRILQTALTGHTATLVYIKSEEEGKKIVDFLREEQFATSQEACDEGAKDPHGILIKWGASRQDVIRKMRVDAAKAKQQGDAGEGASGDGDAGSDEDEEGGSAGSGSVTGDEEEEEEEEEKEVSPPAPKRRRGVA